MSTVVESPKTIEEPHFGRLTPRMAAWREELLDTPQSVCVERAMLTTETYKLHQHEPMVLRRALMVQNVLENMSIFIEPATLIAGNQASANRSAPLMPEYAMDWVIELDSLTGAPATASRSPSRPAAVARHRRTGPTTPQGPRLALMPPASRRSTTSASSTSRATPPRCAHRRRLRAVLVRPCATGPGPRTSSTVSTHPSTSSEVVLLPLRAHHDRRGHHLPPSVRGSRRRPRHDEPDADCSRELAEMSRILTRVPELLMTTFHEAVQSVWLVQLCLQIESNGHSLSAGGSTST